MKTKPLFLLVFLLTMVGFVALVSYQQGRSQARAQVEIANHASIISRSLWNLEPSSPTAYLSLAASANHYESVVVRDDMGYVFLELTHTPATRLDTLLISMKLMQRLALQAPIFYEGAPIGSIEATWLQKTTYTYIYIFICLLLLLAVVWLFLKLFDANRTLEDKVRLRTLELEQEITERRSAEERAVKISQRLTAHRQQTLVGLIDWDLDFRVIEWNPAAETIFGYSRQEALGKAAHELIVPEHTQADVDAAWQALMRQTGSSSLISDNITKSGIVRTCEWRNTALEGGDGAIIGVASIVQDITERRRTEKEMRRLRNYLRNIIDAMPSLLVGVDINCRVTLWNHSAQEATGVSVYQALNQPLVELLPRLTAKVDRIHAAMTENRIRRDAKLPRQIDGETHYEDLTIFPLEVDGDKGAVIRLDDVTDRVRMEDTLVQSEKMLSVGGLAAGMAHEINNPLAGMMQSVSVVKQRLTADLPANIAAAESCGTTIAAVEAYMNARGIPEMLTTIHTEGHRAATIVQNMLSFARKRDDQWSSQNMAELLDTALELASTDYDLKRKYDFRLIRIVKEYEPDLPLIPCEKQMIQQVFLNILRNGAEAMQSSASAQNARFILRVRCLADMVCVEIEDNGPGMDDATRRRVFEPFFTTKPVGVGTGLGLSVSYFIITENHNGHLRVEVPSDGGTRFVVCLPTADNGAASQGHAIANRL
ncbi:MAG: PAS domain S-box protein [Desulfosarcinaceae bacterium]|nr:PAS domain S-box protein [Desulfosarcinaceae bacterium]